MSDEGATDRSGADASAVTEPTLAASVSTAPRTDAARALSRGASVGRYIILSLLGVGGMGEVYKEKALAPTDANLSDVLLALGELRLARGKPADAIAPLEQGIALADAYSRPEIVLTLAEALVAARKDPVRARSLATEARAAYERLGHGPGLARTARFLAEHPSVVGANDRLPP